MAILGDASSRLRGASSAALLAVAGGLLTWITVACLLGRVEHEFQGSQIHKRQAEACVFLPGMCRLWPGDCRVEAFEDGQDLGPRVATGSEVLEAGGGAYALETGGWWEPSTLHFSSTDGSDPRRNGRRYVVRYPHRQLPAALVLLVVSWAVASAVPVYVLRRRTTSVLPQPDMGAAAWCVGVAGALYSLFAVQAWLPVTTGPWLLAVGSVALPAFLARPWVDGGRVPLWPLWIAALLVWGASTVLLGTSYASPPTLAAVVVMSCWGAVLLQGFGGSFRETPAHGRAVLTCLLLLTCFLSLARDAGFDPAGALATVGLAGIWPLEVVNPWTSKFLGHWIVVVGWCALAVLGRDLRARRWPLGLLTALTLITIGLNGSKSAIMALVASAMLATAALRWPRGVRRALVVALVIGMLAAPLLAAVPWRVHSMLPSDLEGGALGALELEVRGTVWEYSRRLIALRPWHGWGMGATANLPGRDLRMGEALGLDPDQAQEPFAKRMALRGGHPHNAAVHIWLDLGWVGALLAAGILVATGRAISAMEERRVVHAALVGLLAATALILAFNYPLWTPEVLSILWMSAALASTVVPRRNVPRRELAWTGLAAAAVVVLGCTLFVTERLSRWWTVHEIGDAGIRLDASEAQVILRGEAWPVVSDGSLDAGAELLHWEPQGTALMGGWAYGPPGAGAPDAVLVFVGSELADVVWPELPSPEAFARSESRDVRALVSGFLLRLQPDRLNLEEPITVVALRPEGAVAAELPPLAAAPLKGATVP